MTTLLYGIPHCDTIKKAKKWLDAHQINYQFHDFRRDGLSDHTLQNWFDQIDWQRLLNKRSTSWRQLPEALRQDINAEQAKQAMLDTPTLIKRPVLIYQNQIHIGFDAAHYAQLFEPQK